MSKSIKLGALALTAIALSFNVSATVEPAKDSLQASLLTYMTAVKDSSSLTVYSAVEFEGLTSQTNCYTPGDYTNFPELGPGSDAEICYNGVINPEDGTKYIAYSPTSGYTVVFKDNLLNHVIVPVGAEGQFGSESSVKLRVSKDNKTPNSQSIFCENDYDQPVRCNGAYIVVAAKETQTDMNAALDSLYDSLGQVASIAVSEQITKAINLGENAQVMADQAQVTADQAIADSRAISTKVDTVAQELAGKIEANKTGLADAMGLANSAQSQASVNANDLTNLTQTVSANTTAIGTKVDADYVGTAIANQDLPDFTVLMARMDALDAKNAELEAANAELSKRVPSVKVRFNGLECPNNICPILGDSYGVDRVELYNAANAGYRIFFSKPMKDSNYVLSGTSSWQRNIATGFNLYERYYDYKTQGSEEPRTKDYITVWTYHIGDPGSPRSKFINVTIHE